MTQLLGTALTDVGTTKQVNQDSLTVKIANTVWGPVAFAAICDGLGGLFSGEVASGNVIQDFDRWFKIEFPREKEWDEEKLWTVWEDIICDVNERLQEYGRKNGIQLGTTLTAVLFLSGKYYVAHVGDCRLYELTEEMRQLTEDQTVVEDEVRRGILTRSEAETDERQHVLLQCIGVSEGLNPAFFSGEMKETASYLLCSDGFRHKITGEEIFELCNPWESENVDEMQENLKQLITLNKNRGEKDNISAIMIRVGKEIC